jgi:ABC-2 type transport system permease protein
VSPAIAVARHEIRMARRERLTVSLLVVFLGMAIVSSSIGWATRRTVLQIYDRAVLEAGKHLPNPFTGASGLEILKNTIIYVVLVGALLAIVAGVQSTIRDRRSEVTELIHSRPIRPSEYVAGKLLGTLAWIGVVLLVAMLGSWLSVWAVLGAPMSARETASLLAFFSASWLFFVPFVVLGIVSGARSRSESMALLMPILVWVALTFILPQLGTAQNPTASLNPVPSAASTSDLFFHFNQAVLQPVSLSEHFKHVASVLLRLRDVTSSAIAGDLLALFAIAVLAIIALGLTTRSTVRRPLHA